MKLFYLFDLLRTRNLVALQYSLPSSFFGSLAFCLSLLFYSFSPYSYHYSYPVACQSLMDIFLNFIGFLSTLILELWLLGVVCTVQVSYLYLMRQRLDKNLIINMEAKIFYLIACSGSFPWFQASLGNHTWTIRATSFG